MNIDWRSLGLVSIVTIAVTVVVMAVFSFALAALKTARAQGTAGRSAVAARTAGYTGIGVTCLIVLYGLYLIIPQFH